MLGSRRARVDDRWFPTGRSERIPCGLRPNGTDAPGLRLVGGRAVVRYVGRVDLGLSRLGLLGRGVLGRAAVTEQRLEAGRTQAAELPWLDAGAVEDRHFQVVGGDHPVAGRAVLVGR